MVENFTFLSFFLFLSGRALPVSNHLDETGGLELKENIRDDVSSTQNALQAARPQEAVQLRQEEEHMVHKPGVYKKKLNKKRMWMKFLKNLQSQTSI